MEQLKEQLETGDLKLQTAEREKTLMAEKLQQSLEEMRTLSQENDELKQLQESLQTERDQLKIDIQDMVNMVRFQICQTLENIAGPITYYLQSTSNYKIVFIILHYKEHRYAGTAAECP